jgi:hypothetical protein
MVVYQKLALKACPYVIIFFHVNPWIAGLLHAGLPFCRAFSGTASFCVYLGLRDGPKPARRLP